MTKFRSINFPTRALSLFATVILTLLVQGCQSRSSSHTGPLVNGNTESPPQKPSTSPAENLIGGNGDPYTGVRPLSGTFYHRVRDFRCEAAGSGPRHPEVRDFIEVNNSDQAFLINNCTGFRVQVQKDSLKVSEYAPNYLSYEQGVYEKFEQPPKGGEPYPVLICNRPEIGPFLGINHVLIFLPDLNKLVRISSFGIRNPQTNQPEIRQEGPQMVTPFPLEFSPSVPGFAVTAEFFFLKVSDASIPEYPGHHQGIFFGLIAGQPIQAPMVCTHPPKDTTPS